MAVASMHLGPPFTHPLMATSSKRGSNTVLVWC